MKKRGEKGREAKKTKLNLTTFLQVTTWLVGDRKEYEMSMEHSRFDTCPQISMRRFLGAKICNYLVRGAAAAAIGAVAQVESSPSAAPRLPGDGLGSVLDVRKRRRRRRRRFHQ